VLPGIRLIQIGIDFANLDCDHLIDPLAIPIMGAFVIVRIDVLIGIAWTVINAFTPNSGRQTAKANVFRVIEKID